MRRVTWPRIAKNTVLRLSAGLVIVVGFFLSRPGSRLEPLWMPVGLIGLGTSFIIWVNYRENRERVRAGAVRMRSGLRFPFIPENTALRIQAGVLLVSGLFLIYRNSMPKWIPIGEILYGLIVFVWVYDREKRAARKRAQ